MKPGVEISLLVPGLCYIQFHSLVLNDIRSYLPA